MQNQILIIVKSQYPRLLFQHQHIISALKPHPDAGLRVQVPVPSVSLDNKLNDLFEMPKASRVNKRSSKSLQRCSQISKNQMLPTRLLSVGRTNSEIRLLETNGKTGRYACLSHCWGSIIGSAEILRTTRGNYSDHIRTIPWSRIPRTFRDAIKVTRALGIQYIWIDSVCIIQNSSDDWEKEAANMHSVYENSYLTIGATSAPGPNGGLYLRNQSKIFQQSGTASSGAQFAVIGRKVCLHSNGRDSRFFKDDRRPLMGRAWILQERLLSPRFLHFSSEELIWECKGAVLCECGEFC